MVDVQDTKKVLTESEKSMQKSVEATKKDFQNLRTGRASTTLLEGIQVNYYDTPTLLKGVANISTPDPKTIQITPWDPSIIGEIEKAIQKSELGRPTSRAPETRGGDSQWPMC